MDVVLDKSNAENADPTFVGRSHELRLFRGAFDRMLAGRRQVVTLAGEPGIGKTRCAEAFAAAAEDRGALVLWGRCYEEPGAPPYWPWVQILREYIGASSPNEVRMMISPRLRDIAVIVPELAGDSDIPSPPGNLVYDPTQARFRSFDAIARFFAEAALQVPLVIVIDNLHWSDSASLALLEFLSQEMRRSRVLLLCTYRGGEVSRDSALLNALAELAREPGLERMRLGGLADEAIAELAEKMLGRRLPRSVIGAIRNQTDGNPFFTIELLQVLLEERNDPGSEPISVRIPDGVREAIGRRLSRLPDACSDLLIVASVFGREFRAGDIAVAAGTELSEVLQQLETAARAGIIEARGEVSGDYRFTHALIRESVYGEISTLDRLRLHGRAGDALVKIYGNLLDSVLTQIAHHFYEAAALGNVDKAATFGMRAARHAIDIFAYEAAVGHYDQVIAALQSGGLGDDERIGKARFLKGSVLIPLGDVQRASEVLLEAFDQIDSLGSPELLADVVSELVLATSHGTQKRILPLIEKVLALLPDRDSAPRARTLASLAFALRSMGDESRIESVVNDAVEMARRAADPAAHSFCLFMSSIALRALPATLGLRLALGREGMDVALRSSDDYTTAKGTSFHTMDMLDAGAIDECESAAANYEKSSLAAFGLHKCFSASLRIVLKLLRGRWSGLEEEIEALLEAGMQCRRTDAEGVYGAQMFVLNRDLGRLQALGPVVRGLTGAGSKPSWPPGLMMMCAEVGLLEEAREQLDHLGRHGFGLIPNDEMYVTCLVFCAETCHKLGETRYAACLYQRLLPYSGQVANHPRAVSFGAVDLYLAMLAAILAEFDQARFHFDRALKLNSSMQAWPWLARTQFHYGAFLVSQPAGQDQEAGRDLLRDAEQLADRLGMQQLSREISQLLRGRGEHTPFPDELTAREVEVLRLVAIGRSNRDIATVLSISLNTVATHMRNILTKTHCANRTEAAAYAMRHGLAGNSSN